MAFAGIEGRSRDVLRAHIPRCSERHLEIHSRIDGQPLYAPGNILVRLVEEKKTLEINDGRVGKKQSIDGRVGNKTCFGDLLFQKRRAVDVMWAGI